MNKAYLFLRSRARWVLLIAAASCACYLAATAGERSRAIPEPPWAARGGEPTNAVEILNYLDAVMAYLPDSTIDELFSARSGGATETELQSIIYRERVAAVRLEDQIIDYNDLGSLTNTLRWAHLADMLRQLLRTIKLYESQWDLTTEAAKINWQTSLSSLLDGLRLLGELERRIDNQADPLENLAEYISLYNLPGAPRILFLRAVRLFWSDQRDRAEYLLEFLFAEANPDGFVRGGSLYFLAAAHQYWHRQPETAFGEYLRVQHYPACLVYIASAYLRAAVILRDMGQPDNALALLAADVPCIDFKDMARHRHLVAASISHNRGDMAGAAEHLAAAAAADPDHEDVRHVPSYLSGVTQAVLSHPLALSQSSVDALIAAGLTNDLATPDDNAFFDAVMRQWPTLEQMPFEFATNRLLNNNVGLSEQRRLSSTITSHIRSAQ